MSPPIVTLQAVADKKQEKPLATRLDPLRLVYVSDAVDLRPLFNALDARPKTSR